MTDDLPVDLDGDDELTDEESEWGMFEWALAAGGTVGAIFVLSWVFNFLAWLAGYALYIGVAVAALYAAYKGLEYMVGGESAADRQTAVPESEVEGELDQLSATGELESELDGLDELDATSDEEVTLGDLSEEDLDADLEPSADLEDDELEQKFAELEREMSED